MVVHVGSGKGGDALKNFWIRLRHSGAKIEAVATDMSPAYIDAVTTHLPKARLVFDRFHVIKLYNDKLSELRRAMYRELTETMQKDVLKGVRWLLLKRPENLDPARNEPQRLEEALRLNAPLATAYYLKAELNEIWEQDDEETAQALLMDWIVYAECTGIRMLQSFAKTLRLHAWGILAYYDHPISTGPSGRHQQQNQNHETSSLWIPRPRIPPTQNPRYPSNQVRFSRMNLKKVLCATVTPTGLCRKAR